MHILTNDWSTWLVLFVFSHLLETTFFVGLSKYIYICMWVRKHSATAVVNMAIWSATGYSQVKVSDYKVHFAVLASYIEGMAVKVSYI